MVKTEIRLIMFFAAEDGEAPYSQQKQDQELTVLALGSPIFPSGCEGKLGVALESLQGRRDLT